MIECYSCNKEIDDNEMLIENEHYEYCLLCVGIISFELSDGRAIDIDSEFYDITLKPEFRRGK